MSGFWVKADIGQTSENVGLSRPRWLLTEIALRPTVARRVNQRRSVGSCGAVQGYVHCGSIERVGLLNRVVWRVAFNGPRSRKFDLYRRASVRNIRHSRLRKKKVWTCFRVPVVTDCTDHSTMCHTPDPCAPRLCFRSFRVAHRVSMRPVRVMGFE
jgi:hypothetical protein